MSNKGMQMGAWRRFWKHVDPCRTDGCWTWEGSLDAGGYGVFLTNEMKQMRAHHFLNGVPLKGWHTDHVRERGCLNKNCVNPEHLEIVSPQENAHRGNVGWNTRSKTHCPSGHPYDEANTKIDKRGRRNCRACHRASTRAAYLKRRTRQI